RPDAAPRRRPPAGRRARAPRRAAPQTSARHRSAPAPSGARAAGLARSAMLPRPSRSPPGAARQPAVVVLDQLAVPAGQLGLGLAFDRLALAVLEHAPPVGHVACPVELAHLRRAGRQVAVLPRRGRAVAAAPAAALLLHLLDLLDDLLQLGDDVLLPALRLLAGVRLADPPLDAAHRVRDLVQRV